LIPVDGFVEPDEQARGTFHCARGAES
jgi:hypothetical protein